jgi:hypothetical protein
VVSFMSCLFYAPGERAPSSCWIADWVDPRANLVLWRRGFLPLLRNRLQFQSRPSCSFVILVTELAKSYFKFCASRKEEMWGM